MKVPLKFREYVWLVNTIHRAGRITQAELQRRWVESGLGDGEEFSRATFHRHKDAIQEIFGIQIKCNRCDNFKYFIVNDEVLDEKTVQNWMLSTLSVNQLISESRSLKERILLEYTPINTVDLATLLEAMKRRLKVKMRYQKYGCTEVKDYEIDPYCLKIFRQRWYVLGRVQDEAPDKEKENDRLIMFSLDRIKDLKLGVERFTLLPRFSAKNYFKYSFGVYVSEEEPVETIRLRAYGTEACRLRDVPIHDSQEELEQGNGYADFRVTLRPTMDFCGHILSRSSQLEVLSPESVRQKVVNMLHDTLKRYENREE